MFIVFDFIFSFFSQFSFYRVVDFQCKTFLFCSCSRFFILFFFFYCVSLGIHFKFCSLLSRLTLCNKIQCSSFPCIECERKQRKNKTFFFVSQELNKTIEFKHKEKRKSVHVELKPMKNTFQTE